MSGESGAAPSTVSGGSADDVTMTPKKEAALDEADTETLKSGMCICDVTKEAF